MEINGTPLIGRETNGRVVIRIGVGSEPLV